MLLKGSKKVLSLVLAFAIVFLTLPLSAVSFKTEADVTQTVIFEDDFDSLNNGNVHGQNDWYSYWTAQGDTYGASHQIIDGKLVPQDFSNGGGWSFAERPATENTLNQKVSVEISNIGEMWGNRGRVHLRFNRNGDNPTISETSYYVELGNNYISIGANYCYWTNGTLKDSNGNDAIKYYEIDWTEGSYPYYCVEFTAYGTNPTKLTATLYNKVSGQVAATVTATDSTDYLQIAGTAALATAGSYTDENIIAHYDNFKYESYEPQAIESYSFEDNFNNLTAGDINGQNGWFSVYGNDGASHQVVDGALHVYDYSSGGDSSTLRPYSEAALNQRVSVDILNLTDLYNYASANVYLRFSRSQNYEQGSDMGYFVEVTRDYIALKSDIGVWGGDKVEIENAKAEYTHYYGNAYRVEFTAQGSYPTVLTATLYDLTAGNVAVATVSANDYTETLQAPGVAALAVCKNGAGSETAIYDNFKYEIVEDALAADSFGTANGIISGDYIMGSAAYVTLAENSLKLKTIHPQYTFEPDTLNTAVLRPMSEASLNQVISVDFSADRTGYNESKWTDNFANIGGAIVALCQGTTATADNCYRLVTEFNQNGYEWDSCPIQLINDKGTVIWSSELWRKSSDKIRLILTVTNNNEDGYQYLSFGIAAYKIEDDGSFLKILTGEASDYDSNLIGKSGTAGFAMFDRWGGTLNIYDFKYSAPAATETDNAYNFYEAESDIAYKNIYYNNALTSALNDKTIKTEGKLNEAFENVAANINKNAPYVAFAVYAENVGEYPVRLRYKLSGAVGEELYAPVVVNGNAYKIGFKGADGEFATSDKVMVAFNQGVNIIYCLAPTSDLGNTANIEYDCMFADKSLSPLNGTFYYEGDANTDGDVNVVDIVRLKKYIAGQNVSVNKLASNLFESENVTINANDLASLRVMLLSSTGIQLMFAEGSVVNPVSVVMAESGGADLAAEQKKNEILSAESVVTAISGKTYYISSLNGNDNNSGKSEDQAWATLAKLRNTTLSSGDVVLFERGSLFRQDILGSAILAAPGVSYGAYGNAENPKPKFYGSSANYADETWTLDAGNVWKINLGSNAEVDAGIVVFDEGNYVGVMKATKAELSSGNDFYYDGDTGDLYLYSALGNPSTVYDSIEIGLDRYMIEIKGNVSDVKIDNLDIRYVGSHAINGNNGNTNITITNCDISFIGGSIQQGSERVRYGNAIQMWGDSSAVTSGITVNNCWIHQVYDAGVTFQSGNNVTFENISFTNNLIQYCNYSVEFFIRGENGDPTAAEGKISNVGIENNIMQFAGYGVCEQRPSKVDAAHICGWETYIGGQIYDFRIINNTFDVAAYNIVNWKRVSDSIPVVSNNTYFMKPAVTDSALNYSTVGQVNAFDQASLATAIAVFDKAPANVQWLNK